MIGWTLAVAQPKLLFVGDCQPVIQNASQFNVERLEQLPSRTSHGCRFEIDKVD
jgi:hypothetical protein